MLGRRQKKIAWRISDYGLRDDDGPLYSRFQRGSRCAMTGTSPLRTTRWIAVYGRCMVHGCLEADYRREQSFGPVAISSWAVPFLLSCGHVRPDSRGCRSKSKARNGCWDALREAHEGTRQSCAHARPMRWHGPGACASHARESSSTLVVFIWPHMPYFWPCTVRVVQQYVACLRLNAQN